MSDRCSWQHDPQIGRWFLPGCMGGAVYGESQCTCPKPGPKELDERLDALTDLVAELSRKIDRLAPINRKED